MSEHGYRKADRKSCNHATPLHGPSSRANWHIALSCAAASVLGISIVNAVIGTRSDWLASPFLSQQTVTNS